MSVVASARTDLRSHQVSSVLRVRHRNFKKMYTCFIFTKSDHDRIKKISKPTSHQTWRMRRTIRFFETGFDQFVKISKPITTGFRRPAIFSSSPVASVTIFIDTGTVAFCTQQNTLVCPIPVQYVALLQTVADLDGIVHICWRCERLLLRQFNRIRVHTGNKNAGNRKADHEQYQAGERGFWF